jgi:hypothetical protein
MGGLTFGIYSGGTIGDVEVAGPPDRPDRINYALCQLQGPAVRPFIVRAYNKAGPPGPAGQPSARPKSSVPSST